MDSESGEVLVLGVPASAPGVEIVETWDTLGMCGTASHDVIFTDVRVPHSAVGIRLPSNAPAWDPRFANVIKWLLSLTAGVYVGIADRAHEEGSTAAGTGRNSAFRYQALTEMLVGQLATAHLRADTAHEAGIARAAAAEDPVEAMITAITTKDIALAAATEIVDLATQLAGGGSFFKRSPLERLARDMRAGAYHPPSGPVSQQMVGRHVLRAAGSD
jgi:alkylation response protein AidB-like acyl-CoA dehydrogenase